MDAHNLVDAHLHLWDPTRLRYGWLAEAPALNRRFDLGDYDEARREHGVSRAVFVQCDCAPEDARAEIEWVSALAGSDPRLAGAVAYAPLEEGDGARAWLEEWSAHSLVRGVRRLLQGEEDPRFCLGAGYLAGVRACAELGLVVDLCILHHQLSAVVELVRLVPQASFVLDHFGKPAIESGELDPWRAELRELAQLPNVVCKLSGLPTEASHATWTVDELRPYVDHALECFGPQRMLFGGDWPVAVLSGGWARWYEAARELTASLSDEEQQDVFGRTAERVYGL